MVYPSSFANEAALVSYFNGIGGAGISKQFIDGVHFFNIHVVTVNDTMDFVCYLDDGTGTLNIDAGTVNLPVSTSI